MTEQLTLQIPEELARRARALAAATNRRFEDAVVDWINRAVSEPIVESLPDDQVLLLCDADLEQSQQEELSQLLASLREGELPEADRQRLDQLMAVYRRGLVLKARAVKEAVSRGLKPRMGDDAA
ncbi:MAG TPA: hypothetical protein VGG61_02025 [Gemmataceae bacterium]|jgi:hypothetical protein